MPAVIDPDIVKIAVQLENDSEEGAQLIEFDQKSTLTGKSTSIQLCDILFEIIILISHIPIFSHHTKFMPKLENHRR